VSCIYGIGDPDLYFGMLLFFERGVEKPMIDYLRKLTEMQYERTPYDLARGSYRVRGDVLELWPAYEDDAVRIEFFGDEIDKITRIDPVTGRTSDRAYDRLAVYPRTHYVTPRQRLMEAMENIRTELDQRVTELRANDTRPLSVGEFQTKLGQIIYVSATPAPYELGRTGGEFVEQVIRPTGLLDPVLSLRPVKGQVDDLIGVIKDRVAKSERVMVT